MTKTKLLALSGLLTGMTVLFQVIPVLLTEVFVIFTILSALPLYIIARLDPRMGIASYIVAPILIMLLSTHEALFFICTNGPIGLFLGIWQYYQKSKVFTIIITGLVLTFSLGMINFVVGIPVFGTPLPGVIIAQLGFLFIFSVLYSSFYLFIANKIYNYLKKLLSFK